MEQGILPKSRHYPIGKVPRIKNKAPDLQAQTSSARDPRPDLSRSSTRSSKHTFLSRSPRRSYRVSRASDPTLDIVPTPKNDDIPETDGDHPFFIKVFFCSSAATPIPLSHFIYQPTIRGFSPASSLVVRVEEILLG
jgi:hypothetical protein